LGFPIRRTPPAQDCIVSLSNSTLFPEKRPAAICRSGKQNLQLLGHEWALLVVELKALYHAGKLDEILTSGEACLPKDEADNFISEQEKSDVVHDLLAFLAKRMLEIEQAEAAGDQGLPGLAGGLRRGQGGRPHAQDQDPELLRA
jgi:hypothetical protein